MTPKNCMTFFVLQLIVQFCTAQIHPEQWTIPIVSDEDGILHFGDPFEQNEATQEQSPTDKPHSTVELPLSADFYQEVEAELSPSQVSQSRAIKTLLTGQETKTLSTDLSQPLLRFIRKGELPQNIANPEAHQQEILSKLSQKTAVMDMSMTGADLATFLTYGDLGPLSADDISIEALSPDTDMESLLNDTYQFGNASVRGAEYQHNTSDFLTHHQTPATFSDSTNKEIQNEKQDRNMVCPTFSGPVRAQSDKNIPANFRQSSAQPNNFKHHVVNHNVEKPYQMVRARSSSISPAITEDIKTKHTGEKPFQCDICQKQFLTSGNYRTHRRTHTGEKPFQCDMCPKRFIRCTDYKTHRRTHTGERPFQCDICPKQFGTSSSYRRHRRTHTGEKPFQCDICLKHFITSDNYHTHRRTHTGEKPFQCDMCPKRFVRCFEYKTHRRTHTGEKPFQCDICPKQFSTSSNYHRHRRTHTGEKPFQCDVCSKQFPTLSSYQIHRRTHTGEKPFQCEMCLKRFPSSSNYQRHRRTHTGEKCFICYWCNQTYSSKSSLIEHIRKCSSKNSSYTADPVVSFFISSDRRNWIYMQ